MNTRTPVIRTRDLVAICLVATASFAAAALPEGVSPGAADRMAMTRAECPTFSWEAVAGSVLYELVVYRLPEEGASSVGLTPDLRDADEVLYARVPGGATSWTPELERWKREGARYSQRGDSGDGARRAGPRQRAASARAAGAAGFRLNPVVRTGTRWREVMTTRDESCGWDR